MVNLVRKCPTWLLVGGLALVGFAVILALRLFPSSGHFTREAAGVGYSTSGPAPRIHVERLVGSPKAPGSIDSSSTVADSSHPSTRAGGVIQDEISRSGSSLEVKGEEEDPNAVIGRQFPVSTSIEEMCKKLSSKAEDRCDFTHRRLAEFAQQARDPVWASNMEAQLRDLVMSNPGYTIRTIECRTSLCVAEVASLDGMFHFESAIGTDSPLHESLMNGLEWQTARERDQSYGTVTVTLMMFERR